MKIVFSPKALEYFNDLTTILYEKEYFGFLESAEKYVEELLLEIQNNLPYKVKRPAPPYFEKYEKKLLYAVFTKNKRTQWYVFFNVYQSGSDIIYLIQYISNNHVDAKHMSR